MLSTTRARERSKRGKKCKCRNRGGKMKRGERRRRRRERSKRRSSKKRRRKRRKRKGRAKRGRGRRRGHTISLGTLALRGGALGKSACIRRRAPATSPRNLFSPLLCDTRMSMRTENRCPPACARGTARNATARRSGPSPTLSPCGPVPRGQLWPTGSVGAGHRVSRR